MSRSFGVPAGYHLLRCRMNEVPGKLHATVLATNSSEEFKETFQGYLSDLESHTFFHSVNRNGTASRLGIKEGDILLSMIPQTGKLKLGHYHELTRRLKGSKPFDIYVLRRDTRRRPTATSHTPGKFSKQNTQPVANGKKHQPTTKHNATVSKKQRLVSPNQPERQAKKNQTVVHTPEKTSSSLSLSSFSHSSFRDTFNRSAARQPNTEIPSFSSFIRPDQPVSNPEQHPTPAPSTPLSAGILLRQTGRAGQQTPDLVVQGISKKNSSQPNQTDHALVPSTPPSNTGLTTDNNDTTDNETSHLAPDMVNCAEFSPDAVPSFTSLSVRRDTAATRAERNNAWSLERPVSPITNSMGPSVNTTSSRRENDKSGPSPNAMETGVSRAVGVAKSSRVNTTHAETSCKDAKKSHGGVSTDDNGAEKLHNNHMNHASDAAKKTGVSSKKSPQTNGTSETDESIPPLTDATESNQKQSCVEQSNECSDGLGTADKTAEEGGTSTNGQSTSAVSVSTLSPKDGLFRLFDDLMTQKDEQNQESAKRRLMEILENPEEVSSFVQNNGIEKAFELLERTNSNQVHALIWHVVDGAQRWTNCSEKLISLGFHRHIVRSIKVCETEELFHVTICVLLSPVMAPTQSVRDFVRTNGAIPHLLDAIQRFNNTGADTVVECFRILNRTLIDAKDAKAIKDADGLSKIAYIMDRQKGSKEVQKAGGEFIVNLLSS